MISIYSVDDTGWNNELTNFDLLHNQLHFTSDYHKLFQNKNLQDPLLFVFRQEEYIYFYPFIKKRIDNHYFDIASVFGYTGPISNTKDDVFINNAKIALTEYLKNENVIAEFIRFNPFLDNHLLVNDNYVNLIELKSYIIINTDKEVEILFAEINSRLRSYLRKSEKEYKNKIIITKDIIELQKFFNLYKKHMTQLGVNDYYLFSDEYYEKLINLITNNGFLICIKSDNILKAGLIFLNYGEISYYHHGARNIDVSDSSIINKLLFWEALKYLKENKSKLCLLGGGVTNENDDSLLKFKMLYGGYSKSLWIGKRILDEVAHNYFCNEWANKFPNLIEKYKLYIDKYHFKI